MNAPLPHDDTGLIPEREIIPSLHNSKNRHSRLSNGIRIALAEYEVTRAEELHTVPRGITSLHVRDFVEAVEARLDEGGS